MKYPLHEIITCAVNDGIKSAQSSFQDCELELAKSPECGGDHRITLYCSEDKQKANTKYRDVDLAILVDGDIRVIIEIEEEGIAPEAVFGKFMAVVASLSAKNLEQPVKLGETIDFIHVIGTRYYSTKFNAYIEEELNKGGRLEKIRKDIRIKTKFIDTTTTIKQDGIEWLIEDKSRDREVTYMAIKVEIGDKDRLYIYAEKNNSRFGNYRSIETYINEQILNDEVKQAMCNRVRNYNLFYGSFLDFKAGAKRSGVSAAIEESLKAIRKEKK